MDYGKLTQPSRNVIFVCHFGEQKLIYAETIPLLCSGAAPLHQKSSFMNVEPKSYIQAEMSGILHAHYYFREAH